MKGDHAIYPSLRGKTVVVTGGAEEIGATNVELFALQGCRVLFLDIAAASAQKTIEHTLSVGGSSTITPIFFYCDLTDLEQVQVATDRIQREYDVVHILINAAAAGSKSRLSTEEVTAEAW